MSKEKYSNYTGQFMMAGQLMVGVAVLGAAYLANKYEAKIGVKDAGMKVILGAVAYVAIDRLILNKESE